MASVDLDGINRLLQRVPEYQAALRGASLPGAPFPTPTNFAQRVENARWAAKQYGDITIPSGQITANGDVVDPNRTHWYTDPRIMGPIAVAAATGIGLLAGPAAGAGSAAADGALVNTAGVGSPAFTAATTSVPQVASQGISAGVASGAGAGAAATGAAAGGKSLTDVLKNLTDPQNALKVAGLIPAFSNLAGGGGNSPFNEDSALMKGALEDMAAARKRYQQAQPLYDTAINMAYGRMPTQYRGAAPEGYGGDVAPAGAYQYQTPRFT